MWQINFTHKAAKQLNKLPKREKDILSLLVKDLRLRGPVVPEWKNYSKLDRTTYHCHLSYSWVACWRTEDNTVKLVQIYYVGSRENAPY